VWLAGGPERPSREGRHRHTGCAPLSGTAPSTLSGTGSCRHLGPRHRHTGCTTGQAAGGVFHHRKVHLFFTWCRAVLLGGALGAGGGAPARGGAIGAGGGANGEYLTILHAKVETTQYYKAT
jgi:hypothetical protein